MRPLVFLTSIVLLVALSASAQTQQGYVKTRGRLVNGQVIAGQRLSGVTVQVKGSNAVVSKTNGAFSFPVPANRFSIQSVTKKGYELVDPEVTARQYSYSSNPLILVLETPSQRISDKLETERKLRRTLNRQRQQQEDEIERLKEQNKLTENQYHQALHELYAEQDKSMNLVSQMAERYSRIDFDQLDEFNRRVSECIIEGRLTEADSLIKSKGDLKERIATHNKHHEANVEARKHLEDSEAMEIKDREDLAQDCYNQFLIHKLQHHPDSAAYYIEQRALLDTTNIDWLYDAAYYFKESGRYEKALSLFLTALRLHDTKKDVIIFTYAANICDLLGKLKDAVQLYEEAIERCNNLELNSLSKSLLLSHYYSSLKTLLFKLNNYNSSDQSKEYGLLLKELDQKIEVLYDSISPSEVIDFEHDPFLFDPFVYPTHSSDNAIRYYQKCVHAMDSIYGQKNLEVAKRYLILGMAYFANGIPKNDFTKALETYQTAYDIINEIDSMNPLMDKLWEYYGLLYRFKRNQTEQDCYKQIDCYNHQIKISTYNYGKLDHRLISTFIQLGDAYNRIEKDSLALQSWINAIELNNVQYGDSTEIASAIYLRMARIYEKQGNEVEALKNYIEALDSKKKWAVKNHGPKDQINVSVLEKQLGSFYFRQHHYELAQVSLFSSLATLSELDSIPLESLTSLTRLTYGYIGCCYVALSDTCKGLNFLFKSLDALQVNLKDGFPDDVKVQIEKSATLMQNGNYLESLSSIYHILQDLNVDDGQKGDYGVILLETQWDINKLRDGLYQVLNEACCPVIKNR